MSSLPEIFSCTLEFCLLYNEHYKSGLAYAVPLLDYMEKDPKQYKAKWTVWKDVVEQTVNKHMNSDEFDWSDELPT